MRNWKHYEPHQTGTTCVIDHEGVQDCRFEIGRVTTGRQRVFSRWFVKVTMPNGAEFIGEDPHNIRSALADVDRQLEHRHCILVAAGIEDGFYETGLSQNSGYGYLPDVDRAVHIMDLPPPRLRDWDNDDFASKLIEEAVAGMFSGK